MVQAKQAVSNTVELDTVYTDLIKVNDELNRNDYTGYLSRCNQKAQALIDKYTESGNTASITTAELSKGVQPASSVFADANTSVDEFLALLSSGIIYYRKSLSS